MIELRKVTKYFSRDETRRTVALDHLDLTVGTGEFLMVIGNNGSGKTTLLNAIAGSFDLDEGEIFIEREPMTDIREYKRARFIGRVYQDPARGTAPNLTVDENLSLAMSKGVRPWVRSCLNAGRKLRIKQILKEIDLDLEGREKSMVSSLSSGQRQCLALYMATMGSPRILLLDEHTASLDPSMAQRILKMTEEIVERKKLTVIMVSHNLEEAINYGDRLVMLFQGRLILEIKKEDKNNLSFQKLFDIFKNQKAEAGALDTSLL